MPETKPTNHLEGPVLEADVLQGGDPPKEFRKVKVGKLSLACFDKGLYSLLVKGKYLAIDYTSTQKGKYTNYYIQAAREIAAPAEVPEPPIERPFGELRAGSERPLERPAGGMDRESSIEAQVAAYCTAQVLAAIIAAYKQGDIEAIPYMIKLFYDGIQEAKHALSAAEGSHTGGAASTTGHVPPFSKPTTETPAPETQGASAGPGAAPPTISTSAIGKDWGLFMIWAGDRFKFNSMSQVDAVFKRHDLPKPGDPQRAAEMLEAWGREKV